MKKYVIQDREAGNIIEECNSLEEAKKILVQYESQDKKDGVFEEDFYEIKEIKKLIKDFYFSSDLNGFVVDLADGRAIYIQSEIETNRLHAGYNSHYLVADNSIDDNQEFSDEEKEAVIEELEIIAADEVREFLESKDNALNIESEEDKLLSEYCDFEDDDEEEDDEDNEDEEE